jgi:hypothetical protein
MMTAVYVVEMTIPSDLIALDKHDQPEGHYHEKSSF